MTVTLITGATGKFGKVIVADRLKRGDTVIGIGTKPDSLKALEQQYPEAARGGRLVAIRCDLMAADGPQSLIEACNSRSLLPEGLINNARSASYLRADQERRVSREDFVGEFVLDVVVPYELAMLFAAMPQSRLKRVINIGSQYGVVAANPGLYEGTKHQSFINYSVAKAGLVHLTRELAVRLAPSIQVNCVSYGGVEGRASPQFQERYAKLTPIGRMLREDEIAGPIAFLLSDESAGMTGHNLVVDGGWTAW